ncbi:MAG: hypothetical protein E8D48_16395, partial [Nitrospira sp.]
AERAGASNENTAFGSTELSHRAHGVLAVFGPFNFPGHLPNGHIPESSFHWSSLKCLEAAPSEGHDPPTLSSSWDSQKDFCAHRCRSRELLLRLYSAWASTGRSIRILHFRYVQLRFA